MIKNKQIRQHLLADPRNLKVVIKGNGEVHIRTNRQRGDGGRLPWWMFAGYREDIIRDMQPH